MVCLKGMMPTFPKAVVLGLDPSTQVFMGPRVKPEDDRKGIRRQRRTTKAVA